MSPDGETATRHERGTSGDASGGTRVSDSPDTRSAIAAYEHRLDLACRKAAEAASAWCWNPTIDNERLLRGAVAEWRTALGLWRLKTREVHNQESKP